MKCFGLLILVLILGLSCGELPTTPEGCHPVYCRIYCKYGFKTNPDTGCEYCDCNDAPTPLERCPPVLCKMYCPYGFKINPETGCEFCSCNDTPIV